MDVDIHWESDAKSILRVSCSGAWNWEDMMAAIQRFQTADPTPVDRYCTIVDLRGISSLPSDAVLHLKGGAQLVSDVNGLIVVINSSSATAILFKMFVSMYRVVGGKLRSAANEKEAYALLGLTLESPKN